MATPSGDQGYAGVIAQLKAGVTLKQTGRRAILTAGAVAREDERQQAIDDGSVDGALKAALEQRRLAVGDDDL